jgi:type I restriction enzyme M protein
VLFLNGAALFRRGRNQNTLEPEHAATLLETYRTFVDKPGIAAVATLDEIAANGYNLNIPLYVSPAANDGEVTLEQALINLEAVHESARASRATLEAEFAKWGLTPIEDQL